MEKMSELERFSDHKSLEVLRNELAQKVGECEKFRDALITHLSGLYAAGSSPDEDIKPIKDFIVDFEVKAIHPVNTILKSSEALTQYQDQIPEFVQILNTWLVDIEGRFGIRWQDRPSAEVVYLPQKASQA